VSALTRLPAKTSYRRPKYAISAAHSARVAYFHPFAVTLGLHQHLKVFYIDNLIFAIAKAFGNLHIFPFRVEL
jgi:hypothetical protein